MAWIETRGKQARVYWRTPTGRTYEPFATRTDAERFLALCALLDGDFDAARSFVRGDGTDSLRNRLVTAVPPVPALPVPAASQPSSGDLPSAAYTLESVFEAYRVAGSRANRRGKDDYRRDFDNHIAPYFGRDLDVRHITGRFYLPGQRPDTRGADSGTNVAAWLDWLSRRQSLNRWGKPTGQRLSAKTIRGLHGLLSGMLEYACRVEPSPLLLRNPCAGSHLPESEPVAVQFLTPSGADALLRHLDGPWYVIVLFALYTGLRFGEIAGLDVVDLDLDAAVPTVQVRQAWARVHVPSEGGGRSRSTRQLARPKSRESHRKIGFSTSLVPHLRPLVEGRPRDAAVFTMPGGGRLHHGNFLERYFRPAVTAAAAETAEVPLELRIHDLRHTHASWMVRVRPLSSVRVRLGHRSILTTERYVHLLAGQDAADAAALDDLIAPDLPELTESERDRLIDLDLPCAAIDDQDDLAS